jgi:hypothetical protein
MYGMDLQLFFAMPEAEHLRKRRLRGCLNSAAIMDNDSSSGYSR